jgi:hypothetical protein
MTNSGVNRLATQLAIWFGCGRFPYGPGTAGALGGLLFAYLVPLSPWLLTALFLAPGVWAGMPVRTTATGYEVIDSFAMDDFAKSKIAATNKELVDERGFVAEML